MVCALSRSCYTAEEVLWIRGQVRFGFWSSLLCAVTQNLVWHQRMLLNTYFQMYRSTIMAKGKAIIKHISSNYEVKMDYLNLRYQIHSYDKKPPDDDGSRLNGTLYVTLLSKDH